MGEGDRDTKTGASRCGPRRLINEMFTPADDGSSPSRSGAGDVALAAAIGRNRKKRVSARCAARCRRRSASARTCDDQNNNPPAVPERRTCSTAHRASAVDPGLRRHTFAVSSPHHVKAAGCSRCGGWTTNTGRSETRESAGRSRRSSPQPGCGCINSVNDPVGQPPPGSSASRAAWPLGTVRWPMEPSCEALHSSGCISSTRSCCIAPIVPSSLYIYTVV